MVGRVRGGSCCPGLCRRNAVRAGLVVAVCPSRLSGAPTCTGQSDRFINPALVVSPVNGYPFFQHHSPSLHLLGTIYPHSRFISTLLTFHALPDPSRLNRKGHPPSPSLDSRFNRHVACLPVRYIQNRHSLPIALSPCIYPHSLEQSWLPEASSGRAMLR